MLRNDLRFGSQSRQLIAVVAIGAVAATIVFAVGLQPGRSVSSAAPVLPALTAWIRDESLPDTAETLSHESLADEEPKSTF